MVGIFQSAAECAQGVHSRNGIASEEPWTITQFNAGAKKGQPRVRPRQHQKLPITSWHKIN